MTGAIAKAEEIAASDPNRYVLLQQFKNPANPAIHEKTTGPEIWDDTDGAIDILVSGVGTGGTITGVSRYIKQTKGKAIQSVAVEPAASPVTHAEARRRATEARRRTRSRASARASCPAGARPVAGRRGRAGHQRRGDSLCPATGQRRRHPLRHFLRGAAAVGGRGWPSSPENAGKTIVVVLPDSGERYLSSILFEGVFDAKGLAVRHEVRDRKCESHRQRRTMAIETIVAELRALRVKSLEARSRGNRPPKLPSRKALSGIVEGLSAALFPNRLGLPDLTDEGVDYFVGHTLELNLRALHDQVARELQFSSGLDHLGDADRERAIYIRPRSPRHCRRFAACSRATSSPPTRATRRRAASTKCWSAIPASRRSRTIASPTRSIDSVRRCSRG